MARGSWIGILGTAVIVAAQPLQAAPLAEVETTVAQADEHPSTVAMEVKQSDSASDKPTDPQDSAQDAEPQAEPEVLVPNPEIVIDGNSVPFTPATPVAPVPPLLPRAVAPPVGDIAVSNINTTPDMIDLGTDSVVNRLVVTDAPVREVLELLARQVGLNVIYAGGQASQGAEAPEGAAPVPTGQTISLDLENEPVQDVFNSVLMLSGLQANRRGNTIFVSSRLPDAARNLISRTLRLNQSTVEDAAAFLAAQGAEVQVYIPQDRRTVTTIEERQISEGEILRIPVTREEVTPPKFEPLTPQRSDENLENFIAAPLLLRGLLVSTDPRLNSLTLTGEPRKVEIATSFIAQLDARRRQVAVNVKVIDVNLLNLERLNSSFSFGVDDNFFFDVDQGRATFEFGEQVPNALFQSQFIAQLQAEIANGNAKILTDPTLVAQEGQTALVQLTQEVFSGTELVVREVGEDSFAVEEPVIREAGLLLQINVSRIDDNGFVTLEVIPSISSPAATQNTPVGVITLLQERTVNSGLIRVRDGKTLILSGIIQETDRASVSKVPILGDIPLLGALFRSTEKDNERREVIVLLTPQIIDEDSNIGYNYVPGQDAREMLRQQGLTVPGNP